MVLGGPLKDRYGTNQSQVPSSATCRSSGRCSAPTRDAQRNQPDGLPCARSDARTPDDSNLLTMDRMTIIRAQQGTVGQPRQSVVMPINEAPVAPPLQQLPPGSPLQRGKVPRCSRCPTAAGGSVGAGIAAPTNILGLTDA